MTNKAFFAAPGEQGLNLTSAAHLCALATQMIEEDKAAISNISLVDTTLAIVGREGKHTINEGYTSEALATIEGRLNRISHLNGFISFFAEGRKALEDYKKECKGISLEEWAKEHEVTLPIYPDNSMTMVRFSTLDDVVKELNIKDKQVYLALEAESAVLGNFIHPGKPLEVARKEMHMRVNQPFETRGSGSDTLIYHYEVSVSTKEVDDLYNKLQKKYRKSEQHLNKMKAQLRQRLEELNLAESQKEQDAIYEYNKLREEYNTKFLEIRNKYEQWQREEQARLSEIKLAIPEKYLSTVKMLNSLTEE